MERQDLTEYSDQELSLQVFNTESLYLARRRRDFLKMLGEIFVFTPEQLRVLKQDLADDE